MFSWAWVKQTHNRAIAFPRLAFLQLSYSVSHSLALSSLFLSLSCLAFHVSWETTKNGMFSELSAVCVCVLVNSGANRRMHCMQWFFLCLSLLKSSKRLALKAMFSSQVWVNSLSLSSLTSIESQYERESVFFRPLVQFAPWFETVLFLYIWNVRIQTANKLKPMQDVLLSRKGLFS